MVLQAVKAALEARRADGLDRAADDLPGPADPVAAARADALVDMAARYLASSAADDGHRDASDDRYLVTIIAEARVLEAPDHLDGVCETDEGIGVDPHAVAAMACDGHSVTIVEDQHGRVLDAGRRTRRPNLAIRRALARRDRGCVFPGCPARRTQAHHVQHWIDGGPTRLENLVSLCKFHHLALHRGVFRIEPQPGGPWRITRGDGQPVFPGSSLDTADAGLEPAEAATVTPDWDGGRIQDLSFIIACLLEQAGLANQAPIPPPAPDAALDPGADTSPGPPVTASAWPEPWPDPRSDQPWPGE